MNKTILLLPLLLFSAFCNGQGKAKQKVAIRRSKIVRTQGIAAGNIGCELQDKQGNIWFSSSGEGVYRYDPSGSFTNFTKKDGLSSNYVNAIIQDRSGHILFGTNDGVCMYDPEKGAETISRFTDNKDINSCTAWSLLEDRDGNIWIGTMESGVYRYTPPGKYKRSSVVNFLNDDDQKFGLGVHHQAIRDMLQDRKGNIWLCSWNGGGAWKYDGETFKNFRPSAEYYKANEDGRGTPKVAEKTSLNSYMPKPFTDYMPKDCIHDDMIFSVTEDKAGNIWFATRRHGACRYDPSVVLSTGSGSFTSFREKEGFVSRGIYDIVEDSKGKIWLTTEDNGVWCYDPVTGKFKNFTTKDGLINNSVFSALQDKNGNIWFGTRNFGLSRYEPISNTFTSY